MTACFGRISFADGKDLEDKHMTGVMVTAENASSFLRAVSTEALLDSDLFIGAVDEETDTACGVLAAGALPGHVLAIRYIYVEETSRNKGAGRALLDLLRDIASEIGVSAIICAVENEMEDVVRLLESYGFIMDMSAEISRYSAKLSDLKAKRSDFNGRVTPLRYLEKEKRNEIFATFGGLNLTEPEMYDGDISCAAYDEEDRAIGALFAKRGVNELSIELAGAAPDTVDSVKTALVKYAVTEAKNRLSEDTEVFAAFSGGEERYEAESLCGGAFAFIGDTILMVYDAE